MGNYFTEDQRLRLHAIIDEMFDNAEGETARISDFTNTLARAIEDRLSFLKEPTFVNPVTGRIASSAASVLEALDYDYRSHWSHLCAVFHREGSTSVFDRHDLPRSRRASPHYGTICVDLEVVETLLPMVQPRKAPKIIERFKENHGINR